MGNILVCDDERSICEMLDIALRREGYKIETVNSGEAAKRKIDGALYDVIVTDIKMPGMSGIEICRFVRTRHDEGTLPILMLTVNARRADVLEGLAAGANDYVFEPVKTEIKSSNVATVAVRLVHKPS